METGEEGAAEKKEEAEKKGEGGAEAEPAAETKEPEA